MGDSSPGGLLEFVWWKKRYTCSTFFNHLRVKSSAHLAHFDYAGVVYMIFGMGKHIQENHLGVNDTRAS